MELSLNKNNIEITIKNNTTTIANKANCLIRLRNESATQFAKGGVNCKATESSSKLRRLENDSKSTERKMM